MKRIEAPEKPEAAMLPLRIQPGHHVVLLTLILLLASSEPGSAQVNVVSWGLNVPAGLTDAVAVAAGVNHLLALRSDDTVIGWGDNQFGQNDIPDELTNVVAISASPGGFCSVALRADGHVVAWPTNSWPALKLPADLTNAAAIGAGPDHAVALRADGTVAAWGANYFDQLDVPTGLTNVVAVAAGQLHSLALKADGTITAWGGNPDGQLRVPPDLTNAVAIAAGGYQSVALRADGTVVAWGQTALVPASATNLVAIAAGQDPVIALRADSTLISWGFNSTFIPPGLSNVVHMVYGLAVIGSGPPFLTTPLVSRSTYEGRTVYFRMAASGATPLNYQWQFNGANLPGANSGVLVVTNAQLTQSGTYTLTVSNALGVARSSAVLTVIPQSAQILADSLAVTNGHLQFNASGRPLGTVWRVQASTNLIDWVNIHTLTSYSDTMTFTDPSTNFTRRFYRMRLRP